MCMMITTKKGQYCLLIYKSYDFIRHKITTWQVHLQSKSYSSHLLGQPFYKCGAACKIRPVRQKELEFKCFFLIK
jgi:hypothetical protein